MADKEMLVARPDLVGRRRWLGGLGLAALSAPILPLIGRIARADCETERVRPRNLVLVYTQQGLEPGWFPTAVGPRGEMMLSEAMQPLEPIKDRLLPIHGLQGGVRNEVLAAAQGTVSMWTGYYNESASQLGYSPYDSIDQIIADRVSAGLPFHSLQLGVRSRRNEGVDIDGVEHNTVYRNGAPQPHEDDPNAVYMRLFGSAAGGVDRLRTARARRRSVLDFLRADLGHIRGAYSVDEQHKVEAHLEGIRQVERELDGVLPPTCRTDLNIDVGPDQIHRNEAIADVTRLQTELLTMALRCGMTRVASLQVFSALSAAMPPLDPPLEYGIAHARHVAPQEVMLQINRWFAGVVGQLGSRLAADVDPVTGRSLLDDTVIAWSSDVANRRSQSHPVPFWIIGGQRENGYFPHYPMDLRQQFGGVVQHTRALRSILDAFDALEPSQMFLGDFVDERSRGPLWL